MCQWGTEMLWLVLYGCLSLSSDSEYYESEVRVGDAKGRKSKLDILRELIKDGEKVYTKKEKEEKHICFIF